MKSKNAGMQDNLKGIKGFSIVSEECPCLPINL